MIHIDQKVTTWQRISIEEEHREELEKFLKENPEADAEDIFNWAWDNDLDPYSETLDETIQLISPEENGGQPTLEITSNNETIYQNAEA
jgi:hypothetical protein